MIPALWISKTGLDAQQTNISVTSNNLANASTVGFKRGRAVFEDLLYQKINQPGGRSSADSYLPEGLMIGSGAKVVATQRQFSQGDVTEILVCCASRPVLLIHSAGIMFYSLLIVAQ